MRIGLVGSGFMGRTHAAAWQHTPAQLVGLVSSDGPGAQAMAAEYGLTLYPDLASLLQAVDVVDICTPTHLHSEMVLQAAQAGRAILCEKPLARTLEQGRAMLEACQQAKVPLLVGHVVRFFPEYASAREIVRQGQIGQVGVIRLTRCSFKPNKDKPESWFHDSAKSGGMMLDLMIHDFDYARWVAGDVESVYAKRIERHFNGVPGDYALAILRHRSGALSHVEGGWAYPAPMFQTSLEIAGSHGLIEHPASSSVPIGVHLHETSSSSAEIAVPSSPLAEDPYITQIRHFYAVLAGHTAEPRVSAHDALAALQIALAALQSAETDQPVHLEALS